MQRTRKELQQEALDALLRDRYVQVNWGTGVGKSRVAIKAVEALFANGAKRILLLVAETAHKENWRREFVEALGERLGNRMYGSVIIECYASLHKYEGTSWDAIVADEAHHLRSETRVDLISTMKADYFLCLSATLSCQGDGEDLKRMLEMSFGVFTELDFSVQDAIDSRILNEPHIIVHVIPLADMKKPVVLHEEWGLKEKRVPISCTYGEYGQYMDRRRYPDARIEITCSPKEAYGYYSDKIDFWENLYFKARNNAGVRSWEPDNESTIFYRNKWLRYCSLRKSLVGHIKTTFCKSLLAQLSDKKYVCFCSDVEQGIELGEKNVIYAKRDDGTSNLEIINSFNENRIRSIFAVNMIQEGQNLAGIQAGIVVQLGGKERQFIQKFGRAMRSRTPEQHIVVVNGTRDVDYLRTAIAGISTQYIEYKPYGSLRSHS